jgi:hypothetical protein
MATAVKEPRTVSSRHEASAPARPSGVMPVFRGTVSLPTPAVVHAPVSKLPPLRLARAAQASGLRQATPARVLPSDEAEWNAALSAAKQRALVEEEERAWQAAIARAKAQVAEQEAREWAALRARAHARPAPPIAAPRPRRLFTWP